MGFTKSFVFFQDRFEYGDWDTTEFVNLALARRFVEAALRIKAQSFLIDGEAVPARSSRSIPAPWREYRSFSLGRQWGWLSVNDIRRLIDMDPIGPEGDVYLTQLNMAPVGETPPEEQQPAPANLRR